MQQDSRIMYRFWEHSKWNDPKTPFVPVYCNIVDGCNPSVAVGPFEFCTGLKDNGGTVIYEGDYLMNDQGEVFEVVWAYEMAHFEARIKGWRDHLHEIIQIEPMYEEGCKKLYLCGNTHEGQSLNANWCEKNHSSMIG